ncbi:MAG: putative glycoside hydrolase [Candidatus Paceibacterota bacterium]
MQRRKQKKRKRGNSRGVLLLSLLLIIVFGSAALFLNRASLFAYRAEFRTEVGTVDMVDENPESIPSDKKINPRSMHVKTPEAVKALYMTSCVVSTPSFRDKLVEIIDTTEINTLIIDVKDYTGTLSFIPKNENLMPLWKDGRCGTSEMEEFIKELHKKGVYVIARITVFQDPYYATKHPDQAVQRADNGAVWKDGKGLSFIDVSSKEAWDHVIQISEEAYDIGFDELNFDYIRFPSDGDMQNVYYPHSKNKNKADALEEFFAYLDSELERKIPEAVTSADIFGMTTTNYDDLGIGQILEKALPYFDYIAPMVYPSHYPSGFNGWGDPNTVPGPLIKYVMDGAVRRTVADTTPIKTIGSEKIVCEVDETEEENSEEVGIASVEEEAPLPEECTKTLYTKMVYDKNKIRPWLQDFSYGGTYDADAVRAQIQATYDSGLNSWMLWDPGNTYTKEALLYE